MTRSLFAVALFALSLAVAPMAAAPQKGSVGKQAAETGFNVVIVPPDGLYEVTIRPDTPAPKGERAYWSIYPRKSVKTVKRNELEWKMRVPKGPYEASYTTYINNEQVDSFVEFTVGGGPPPPDPDPDPTPPPTPDETKLPFPPEGFFAMFVYQDTDQNKYTPTHRTALGGEETQVYLNQRCSKSAIDNLPAWRNFDVNQAFIGEGSWKEAHKRAVADLKAWEAKNPGRKTPWLLAGNGTKGFSGPVPADSVDATMTILKRYGG